MFDIKTEKFLNKLKIKGYYNLNIDYSKVIYTKPHDKIILICTVNNHGEFQQLATNQMSGQGCPKCANNIVRTTESFLEILKNRGLYNLENDYSQLVYKNSISKVYVIDKYGTKHLTSPRDLLDNHGLTLKSAINKNEYIVNRLKHNGYLDTIYLGCDFSNLVYINDKTKVSIIDKNNEKHEMFHTSVLCGYKLTIKSAVNKTEYFLNELNRRGYFNENGVYYKCDFSLFKYTRNIDRVVLLDKYKFEHCILTSALLDSNELTFFSVVDKTKYFIHKANNIHNKKYGYSLVDYQNSHIKVEILCPIHNSFFQVPANHLYGQGCPACSETNINLDEAIYFYVYHLEKDVKKGIGYGITNNFVNREYGHTATFKLTNTKAILLDKYYFTNGIEGYEFEKNIKKDNKNIDFGIKGFKTECLSSDSYQYLIDNIEKTNAIKLIN